MLNQTESRSMRLFYFKHFQFETFKIIQCLIHKDYADTVYTLVFLPQSADRSCCRLGLI